MGFFAGFLVAIPVGVYFGEKRLNFRISYFHEPRGWGHIKIDFQFIDVIVKDINKMLS